jgi:hypothetical protein
VTTSLEPEHLRQLLDDVAAGPTTTRFDNVYRRAHRRRQAWRSGLVAATVAVVAAAIVVPTMLVSSNAAPQQVTSNPTPSPAIGVHSDPLSLVGRWHLVAAGEAKATTLIIGEQLVLFRPCGVLEGEWRADQDGLFVGDLNSGDGNCFSSDAGFDNSWLSNAASYRSEGRDRLLLNASGQVVARLSPGGRPTTSLHGNLPSIGDAPTLTSVLRAALRSPAALPAGLRPVTRGAIVGRWQPLQPTPHSPETPIVTFNAYGIWSGSDGCNGYGGRFAVGSAGELLTTSDGSTLVGCLGSMAPVWVINARRAGFDGHQLVLLDTSGMELGRLVRQQTAR